MAHSVTEGCCVMTRVGVEVCQERNGGTKQKYNWEHGNVMSGQRSQCGGEGTWVLGLLQCTVRHLDMASRFTREYSWSLGVNYKNMIDLFVNELWLV